METVYKGRPPLKKLHALEFWPKLNYGVLGIFQMIFTHVWPIPIPKSLLDYYITDQDFTEIQRHVKATPEKLGVEIIRYFVDGQS